MEVHFPRDVRAKLEQMARESGRRSDELLEDAVISLYDDAAFTRYIPDRRCDVLESGRIKPVPGDEVFARLRQEARPDAPEASERI
jgi:hypothetical protein